MLQFIHDGFVDEIVDGGACACHECCHARMQLGSHAQVQLAAEWLDELPPPHHVWTFSDTYDRGPTE